MDNQLTNEQDEYSLMERLRRGDELAMKQIFRVYYHRLRYFAVSMIREPMDAEDIVQEALLNFWLNVKDKGVTPDNIQAYLYRMVRNRCTNYVERQRMLEEKNAAISEQFNADLRLQLDAFELREELFYRVSQAFTVLTPIQVQVMRLLYVDDLSIQEAAEALQTTANNIRNHKARAIERLRILLQGTLFLYLFYLFFKLL